MNYRLMFTTVAMLGIICVGAPGCMTTTTAGTTGDAANALLVADKSLAESVNAYIGAGAVYADLDSKGLLSADVKAKIKPLSDTVLKAIEAARIVDTAAHAAITNADPATAATDTVQLVADVSLVVQAVAGVKALFPKG